MMNSPPRTPDALVHSQGEIFLFCPLTQEAKQWIAEHVEENAMWFSHALMVEHRFAWALAVGMKDAGLELE